MTKSNISIKLAAIEALTDDVESVSAYKKRISTSRTEIYCINYFLSKSKCI
jgi:hypothetical protein